MFSSVLREKLDIQINRNNAATVMVPLINGAELQHKYLLYLLLSTDSDVLQLLGSLCFHSAFNLYSGRPHVSLCGQVCSLVSALLDDVSALMYSDDTMIQCRSSLSHSCGSQLRSTSIRSLQSVLLSLLACLDPLHICDSCT